MNKSYESENLKKLDLVQYFSFQNKLDSSFYYQATIDSAKLDSYNKARYYEYLAQGYNATNEPDISFKYFLRAQELFKQSNNDYNANAINFEIYSTIISQTNFNYNPITYLEDFGASAIQNNWTDQIADYYTRTAINNFNTESRSIVMTNLNRALDNLQGSNNILKRSRIYAIKSVYLAQITRELDSADFYIDKSIAIESEYNIPHKTYYSFINKAAILRYRGDYEATIETLKLAENLEHTLYKKNNLKFLYNLLSKDYEQLKDYETALNYLKKHITYRDSVNISTQNLNLVKYQTLEKDKKILVEQQEKTKNRNIAIGLGTGVVAVGVIGLLGYKNSRRKQRIAEQERELEIQKTQTVLKEQELITIDAMLEGQEKERQRLASDLHDSVGATLASARLQFNHLYKNKDSQEDLEDVYKKTDDLLYQAYQEIRSMSHLKNSGVLAKDSLIPALEKLTTNASVADNIHFQLECFGLDQRLDNTLEISIFRIIQELTTNIIKHAKASEAQITLTQHDDTLNIIVEDNGIGFEIKNLNLDSGLGLSSIEKRINHINGTFEIDSTPKRGTTILIDIPIKNINL